MKGKVIFLTLALMSVLYIRFFVDIKALLGPVEGDEPVAADLKTAKK